MYGQGFISILIDFYLEKRSPLINFSEKKHSMGDRYVEPDFQGVIQIIANMVQRAYIPSKSGTIPFSSLARQSYSTFQLSDNDNICLNCRDFYDKTLKDKCNPQALGIIIQQLGFENEGYSYSIADILLRGINKTSFDESRPYLETMTYFLNTIDFLQIKRAEWLLGFPQPTVTTSLNSYDSFGVYGNTSIEDSIVTYESPLNIDGVSSIINYMLHNRKRLENIALICLRHILLLMDINQSVFEYIIFLPPPSYNYAKFTDWIMPFLDHYFAESKKYAYTSYPKEELAQETLKLWKTVEAKVEHRLQLNEKAMEKQTEAAAATTQSTEGDQATKEGEVSSSKKETQPVLRTFFKTYIIGQTVKEDEVERNAFTPAEDPEEVSLITVDVTCYITESKPTGKGNQVFRKAVLPESKFNADEIKPDSAESYFVKPKQIHPLLDSNKKVRQYPLRNDIEAAVRHNVKEGYQCNQDDYPSLGNVDNKGYIVYIAPCLI